MEVDGIRPADCERLTDFGMYKVEVKDITRLAISNVNGRRSMKCPGDSCIS